MTIGCHFFVVTHRRTQQPYFRGPRITPP